MKGLILKDFLILRTQMRLLAVIFVLYLVMGVVMKDFSFFIPIILLVSAMLVITTCAYDDSCKWNLYAGTLPLNRNQICLSKYISSVLFVLIGVALGLVFIFISVLLGIKLDIAPTLFSAYIMGMGALLFVAVMLPVIFKFGVEKSRIIMPLLVVLIVAGAFALKGLGIEIPSVSAFTAWSNFAFIPVLLLFALSYLLSCRILAKKEA